MEDIHKFLRAVASSLRRSKESEETKHKYDVVREEREFERVLEQNSFETYLVSRLPGDRYATVKEIEGEDTLIFDTESIPAEFLVKHSDTFEKAFAGLGGVAIEGRQGIAPAVSSEDEGVDDIYELNEARIPRKLLPVFEEALVLRAVEEKRNLSRGTVFDWRGEIADSYSNSGGDPAVAQNLISLASTGYFDKDDVFDSMYENLVSDGSVSIQEFNGILAKIIKNNSFAVFVDQETSPDEAISVVEDKIKKVSNYAVSPEFVEVCGKGNRTHAILDGIRDGLDEETYDISSRRNRKMNQKILRIVEK